MVKDFQNRRPPNHGAFSRYLRTHNYGIEIFRKRNYH